MGKYGKFPRKEIVVGDIVVLNTGEEIPADGIIAGSYFPASE